MAINIPKDELNEFSLPRVCVVNGKPGPVTFQKVQFQFAPQWLAIFFLAPLIYLLLYFLLRKTASGTLPFSEEGWNAVKAARRNMAFAGLALFAGIAAGVGLTRAHLSIGENVVFASLGLGIVALAVTTWRFRKTYPSVTLIDDRSLTLKLPSADAEQAFRAHLNAGAAGAAS